MRQLFQDLRSGRILCEEVPAPSCPPGHVLVRTVATAISPGTERMLVEFGRANLLNKARSQPERVRQVLDKIRTDGVLPTLEAVFSKLGEPLPLGYCNAGIVIGHGDDRAAMRFPIGTRVASNGPHAEVVAVPANLCCAIPAGVEANLAATTPLGAIALQGVRLAAPTLGESFFVMGLGIVGQLVARILMANGCRVMASDLHEARRGAANGAGATTIPADAECIEAARRFSGGEGVDAVIIAASTDSPEPLRQAVRMCRRGARIVLVGVVGAAFDRDEFFRREVSFRVSASYGPGRYDEDYETGRTDLPAGHVRWTAGRNFAAYLNLLADSRFRESILPMVYEFPAAQHEEAYSQGLADPACLLPVLRHSEEDATLPPPSSVVLRRTPSTERGVGVIGSGAFARRVVLPILGKMQVPVETIVSSRGASAARAAESSDAATASTDASAVLEYPACSAVFILTRHDSHAEYAARALRNGKHVFVEKPLAMSLEELRELVPLLAPGGPVLRVGFNRRHAPLISRIRTHLSSGSGAIQCSYFVNAGAVDAAHWTLRPESGGGRVIGELCHFIDTCSLLAGTPLETVQASAVRRPDASVDESTLVATLNYQNGSLATIQYWSGGPRTIAKERLTVMRGSLGFELDNFRTLSIHENGRIGKQRALKQDKGHRTCLAEFLKATRAKQAQDFSHSYLETTLATFAVRACLSSGQVQRMADWWQRLAEPAP